MTVSTKNRGVRALITAGIAGASLVAVSMTGSPASGQKNCYYPDQVARFNYCTPVTRPEITTPTTEGTTPTTQGTTPTTQGTTPTTQGTTPTTQGTTPTTAAPTTTAPAGVGGAGAARPIAAQASYAG